MSAPLARNQLRLKDRGLRRELKTLIRFVHVYCAGRHAAPLEPVRLKMVDVEQLYGRRLRLCASCRKLLAHAIVKRIACPLDPKPMCKKCPEHCYAPRYRAQIRELMKYSGRRLVLRGRLDYLIHLFW